MLLPSICVEHVSKKFDNFYAVKDINFTVRQGECFGLLGPNGAGKSTLIKMMTTLLTPDDGDITIVGHSVRKNPVKVRQSIGYVPQMLSVDGTLTAYENLLIFAKLYGLGTVARKERIPEILHLLGLEEDQHRQVKTFSGGMVRRLEIGQAILHQPQILFLDEPTVGLDPVARRGVWSHIEKLREKQNMTILLTTHYMEEAESLCSHISIMNHGEVAASGTLNQLQEQSGIPKASLDQLFVHYAGTFEEKEGRLKDVSRTRRTARKG